MKIKTPFECPSCTHAGRLGEIEEEITLVKDPGSPGDQFLGLPSGEKIESHMTCVVCGTGFTPSARDSATNSHERSRAERIRERTSHVMQVPDGLASF